METKKERRKQNLLAGKLRPKWWSAPPTAPFKNKKKLAKRRAKAYRSKASRQKNWTE